MQRSCQKSCDEFYYFAQFCWQGIHLADVTKACMCVPQIVDNDIHEIYKEFFVLYRFKFRV